MKKSKWTFTRRLVLPGVLLVLVLAVFLNAVFSSDGLYSVWDWLGAIVQIAVSAILLVYILARVLYARNLRKAYITAIGMLTVWLTIVAFDALSAMSIFTVKDWIELALYAVVLLCCTVARQRFKACKRIGRVLFILVVIFYIILCCLVGFSYFNYMLSDGLVWYTSLFYAVRQTRWYIADLLIDAAVWMLFPTVMMSSVSSGALQAYDVEAQLLQLKEDYENGYMSQKEYADMQAALLEKL